MKPLLIVVVCVSFSGPVSGAKRTTEIRISQLIEAIRTGGKDERSDACQALIRLGPLAKSAGPKLLSVFADRREIADVRVDALTTYIEILGFDPQAMPVVVEAVKKRNETVAVRGWAIHVLCGIVRQSKVKTTAHDLLLSLFRDKQEDPKIREVAGYSVCQLLPVRDRSTVIAIGVLKDQNENADLRLSAVTCLGILFLLHRKKTPNYIPPLFEVVKNRKEASRLRSKAIYEIAKMSLFTDFDAPPLKEFKKRTVPWLIATLNDSKEKEGVRSWSGVVLVAMKRVDKKHVLGLVEVLNNKDRFVHTYAISALSRLGAAAKTAVPALLRKLKDEKTNKEIRENIIEALRNIDRTAR